MRNPSSQKQRKIQELLRDTRRDVALQQLQQTTFRPRIDAETARPPKGGDAKRCHQQTATPRE
jgi:hypothetical protein